MVGGAGYRPVDARAYGGRPRPGRPRMFRAAVLLLTAAVLAAARTDAAGAAAAAGIAVAGLSDLLVAYVRRREPPVVVDAPGVYVSGTGDGGIAPRLVHWEMVDEVVLLRAAGHGRPYHAVGLRLRNDPHSLAVRRALDDWALDRTRLEHAVARFAPPGVAVVEGPPDHDERTSAAAPTPSQPRTPSLPPVIDRTRAGTYLPVHPDALVIRATIGSPRLTFGLAATGVALFAILAAAGHPVLGFGFSAFFWLYPLWELRDVLRGSIHLAVDEPGVYFGTATTVVDDHEPRFVTWQQISSVVRFELTVDRATAAGRRAPAEPEEHLTTPAVGVTETGTDGVPRLVFHRAVHGWTLDPARLETAVRRFAPGVPVVDGPRVEGRRLGGLAGTDMRVAGPAGT
jgi:hypothetical protein